MKIFFDTEFTGLHKKTTLISIGCVDEKGSEFYAELSDYAKDQCDDWITENVIANLVMEEDGGIVTENRILVRGTSKSIAFALECWLNRRRTTSFDKIEMWSDSLAYDWVLFNHLWGHAFNIPKCVYYIPFDICTMMKIKGVDPDISREEFSGMVGGSQKHNALWDARVIKACYEKLIQMEN